MENKSKRPWLAQIYITNMSSKLVLTEEICSFSEISEVKVSDLQKNIIVKSVHPTIAT